MKILILVLSLKDENGIYSKFYETQKKTWDSINVEGVETYYFFGNQNKNKFIGNDIFLNVNESLYNCGHKTLLAFDLIKNLDFDFVFRTNSSSYVDKQILKDFLKSKKPTNHYSGVIGTHAVVNFASGCGYVISKDVLLKVLENKNNWNHSLIDDVSLAVLLNNIKIYPESNPRFDVIDIKNIPTNFFHYRLMTPGNRNNDINNMYKIFELKKNEFYNGK